jgi:polysaccharide biosynthesis protein PslH
VPVYLLPNGVDTEFFRPDFAGAAGPEEDALVFTGSMDWLPNDDAILYFIKDILPLIWEKNPEVKLYVVGKSPSVALTQAKGQDDRIVITRRVDDVRPYLSKCKVFITPLRIGGGTRLKILEALAMEKAIVATSIGAEGIEYKENENMAIADRPKEFANKVLDLMASPEKRKALGKAGRQLVLGHYDWSIIGKRLNVIYEGLIHGKK